MADILNNNIVATNSFATAPVSGQDFGTPLYLAAPGSLGAGFTESVRFYADPEEVATDLASGDLTATAAAALNTGLSQPIRVIQVACGQVPGAVSKVTEVTVGGVVTNADGFSIVVDVGGGGFNVSYAAVVPTDDAAAVVLALIDDAASNVPDRYVFSVGDSPEKMTITDQLKGADATVTADVTGVATIVAATTVEPSGLAEGQAVEITDSGGEGDIWTLQFDGRVLAYTAPAAPTPESVASALKSLVSAVDGYSAFDSASVPSAEFIITPDYGAVSINALSLVSDGVGTNTITEEQAATPIGPLMDALFLENSSWYGLASEVKTQGIALDLAAWAETNERLFLIQTSEAGALTADSASTGFLIDALSYGYTSVEYHVDDAEEMAYAWQAFSLATDPDVGTTTWAYKTLVGITANLTITTTQRAALESLNVGFYAQIRSTPVAWEGRTADGNLIDVRISRDWLDARIEERVTDAIVSASNRGTKIPLTDGGIQQLAGEVRALLFGQAIQAGHTTRVLDVNGNVVAPRVEAPRLRDVPQSDINANTIRIPYWAELSGAIHKFFATGYLT